MTLHDKMLAVMAEVNRDVAERSELVEMIAIALLTRKTCLSWRARSSQELRHQQLPHPDHRRQAV